MKNLLFTCAVILLVSCSEDDDVNTQASDYGLALGNNWTYSYNSSLNSYQDRIDYVEVVDTTTFQGELYYVLRTTVTIDGVLDPRPNFDLYLRVDSDGKLVSPNNAVHAYQTGEPYYHFGYLTAQNQAVEYRRFLVNDDVTIVTPAGTFEESLQVNMNLWDLNSDEQFGEGVGQFFYHPQIGLLKEEVPFVSGGDFVYTKILESFNVN